MNLTKRQFYALAWGIDISTVGDEYDNTTPLNFQDFVGFLCKSVEQTLIDCDINELSNHFGSSKLLYASEEFLFFWNPDELKSLLIRPYGYEENYLEVCSDVYPLLSSDSSSRHAFRKILPHLFCAEILQAYESLLEEDELNEKQDRENAERDRRHKQYLELAKEFGGAGDAQ